MINTQTEKSNKQYLERFFDEKVIPYTAFNLYDKSGTAHYIDTEVVVEFIQHLPETTEVVNTLRKLDFHNQPIIPFLKYIAEYMINNTGEF